MKVKSNNFMESTFILTLKVNKCGVKKEDARRPQNFQQYHGLASFSIFWCHLGNIVRNHWIR